MLGDCPSSAADVTLEVPQKIEETLLLAIANIRKVSLTIFITKYFSFQTNVFLIHEELRKT
ncbi:MAG: hypothetical protein V7K53_20480 [Nostoc sp.]